MTNWIILLVVLVVLYLIVMIWSKSLKKRWSQADLKFFSNNWQRILHLADQKHAVIEADKLLDHMLKRRGFQGTLGDKLKKTQAVFTDRNAVWEAHKVRNKLAHELDYRLSESEHRRAINGFEKAFRDLGLK